MSEDFKILAEDISDYCTAQETACTKLRIQIERLLGLKAHAESKRMKRCRITFQVGKSEKHKIEAVIKKAYPKFRTVSDLVKAALRGFLAKEAA
jgi:predicted NAD-dependent protein-ADP-ribosyltransferase YbiA (DUF1768 family)